MRLLLLIPLLAIFSCSKEEIVQPSIYVHLNVKGEHKSVYTLNNEHYTSNGKELKHSLPAKLNDQFEFKLTRVSDTVEYYLHINDVKVDSIKMYGNLTGYEIQLKLTEIFLKKKGVL